MTPNKKAERLRRELLKRFLRLFRDPDYAARLMKWYYEHPAEWARLCALGKRPSARRPKATGMTAARKIPPRERAVACRRAVLDYLGLRFVCAFDAAGMANSINADSLLMWRHNDDGPDWTEREILRAADSLVARGLARFHFGPFCEAKYYQATDSGRAAYEAQAPPSLMRKRKL